ncbi:MAG TPA: low affinity iron permease family protein [Phenylobacterium sp.]|jgi:low affinity Fe/Cu permease|nr:low affinity iron permease family protein [Phenylobacterium sp.]
MPNFSQMFSQAASGTSRWTGRPSAFLLCCLIVAVWAVTGPVFHYSDTWQLVINTGTTIVTFLMVFLIQNTQNRDNAALQAKLDELIRASKAKNEFIGIEHLSDQELDDILVECEQNRPEVLRRAEARAAGKRKAQLKSSRSDATRRAKAPAAGSRRKQANG